jgi:hypothetical protein
MQAQLLCLYYPSCQSVSAAPRVLVGHVTSTCQHTFTHANSNSQHTLLSTTLQELQHSSRDSKHLRQHVQSELAWCNGRSTHVKQIPSTSCSSTHAELMR